MGSWDIWAVSAKGTVVSDMAVGRMWRRRKEPIVRSWFTIISSVVLWILDWRSFFRKLANVGSNIPVIQYQNSEKICIRQLTHPMKPKK